MSTAADNHVPARATETPDQGAAAPHDGLGLASLPPIKRAAPPRLAVQAEIQELIARRVFRPGDHIGEHALARRLGTSRHPVREALQALELEGWVRLEVGRGAFVHEPTDREVQEAFRVRAALESEGVRAAASRAGAAEVQELRNLVQAGRESLALNDADTLVTANARFHRSLALLSGNRLLTDLLESLDLRIRWYFSPVALVRGVHSWNEHEAIVEAISQGEDDKAARLMREHSHNTEAAYMRAHQQD